MCGIFWVFMYIYVNLKIKRANKKEDDNKKMSKDKSLHKKQWKYKKI